MLKRTDMRLFQSFIITFAIASLLSACQPNSLKPQQQWQHAVEGAYAASLSNDGNYAVVSSIHHGITLWDITQNKLLFTWSQQQNNADNLVLATAISADNKKVLTANKNSFSLWDMQTGENRGFWQIKDSSIRDIAIADDGYYVLWGKSDSKVEHMNMRTGRRLEFLGHSDRINSVAMLPNGRIAMSGGNDFTALVWDTLSGQVIYRFNHSSRVTKVALDPQKRFAFSADSKKQASIWDLTTGKLVSNLQYTNRQEVFSSVTFSPDGQYLLTGAPSRKVSIWRISDGKRLTSWRVTPRKDIRPAGAVVYSAVFLDNNQVLTESSAGYAELWQPKLAK